MIDRLSEWYSIVSLNPSSEVIQHRHHLLQHWASRVRNHFTKELILEAVSGLFITLDPNSNLFAKLNSGLDQDESAPRLDFVKDKKEFSVLMCLVIGDLLDSENHAPDQIRSHASLSLLSSMGLLGHSTLSAPKYLELLHELRDLARSALHHLSTTHRSASEEKEGLTEEISALTKNPAELSSNPDSLSRVLAAMDSELVSLKHKLRVAWEESEVMWWIFAKRSKITGKPFESMSPYSAALCAGRELADICLLPPLINYPAAIEEALSSNESIPSSTHPLENAVSQWERDWLASIKPVSPKKIEAIERFPRVFPLHWIILRYVNQGTNGNWTSDFYRRTGIGKRSSITPLGLADQIFLERITSRAHET